MLKDKVIVSCVSYLNSKPFIFGLNHHPVKKKILLSLDHPAHCAHKVISGSADIGLIPVASIPLVNNAHIFPTYCIGADGPVKSVLLLSQVPLNGITNVLLDYQSNTSTKLVQILANNHWRINPSWLQTSEGFEGQISGNTAGVVIGDRALMLRNRFEYVYDLSEEWKKFTGLPFVFACWVSRKRFSNAFETDFEEALKYGLTNLDEVINELKLNSGYTSETESYLRKSINYDFDGIKKKSMKLFLNYCTETTVVKTGISASVL